MGRCVSLSHGSIVPLEKDRGIAIQAKSEVEEPATSVYLIYESLRFIYLVYGLFWM